MIAALAGRRIDVEDGAEDAREPRFPAENADRVAVAIRSLLKSRNVHTLVCSAACGADLLALDVAGQLGIRRRVVLPSDPDRFRTTSVVDRKDISRDWGGIYDRARKEVERQGDLVVLLLEGDRHAAYLAANTMILQQASHLAKKARQPVLAVVVWNGASRGTEDVTAAFLEEARRQQLPVEEIFTL